MPEGAKERGVGLAGALDHVSNVQRTIFDKLNARRITALAASPAEVGLLIVDVPFFVIIYFLLLSGYCCI